MRCVTPATASEAGELLREAATVRRIVEIVGKGSKALWGGPAVQADLQLSTASLRRVLEYEVTDLTISVEAGFSFASLQQLLAQHGQMIALDPPYASEATIGGVIASNSFGTFKRRYGAARDLVIGMQFITAEGRIVSSGGRVVKNVAGLDMAKLLIGSFGTLALISSVNLRVHPLPERWRTFLYSSTGLQSAAKKCRQILTSQLRPDALELINPNASEQLGFSQWTVAVRVGGSTDVLRRYSEELGISEWLDGDDECSLWERIREFAPAFIRQNPEGVLLRAHVPANRLEDVLSSAPGAAVCRCGTGIVYLYCDGEKEYEFLLRQLSQLQCPAYLEAGSQKIREGQRHRYLSASTAAADPLPVLKSIKALFDANFILSPGRLYGRI